MSGLNTEFVADDEGGGHGSAGRDAWREYQQELGPWPITNSDRHAENGRDETAVKLHATLDAEVWADEFMARFTGRIVGDTVNRYLMITWFANAIEIGRAAGRSEHIYGEE